MCILIITTIKTKIIIIVNLFKEQWEPTPHTRFCISLDMTAAQINFDKWSSVALFR